MAKQPAPAQSGAPSQDGARGASGPRARPMSPHLTIWRWGPHMLVSILHRITGGALTVLGLALLTWWLWAISEGGEAYGAFAEAAGHPLGLVVLIGLTWAFFQHLLSGIRHLAMDSGSALELPTNKRFAILTIVGSLILTLLVWVPALGGMR
ncbi:MAG: succinate dehydrogenase, cytochrome b556 subunit [Sphingomonas sp.]|nr:succinate dehydrogenase, cytochrome b556 subunit [Sphingomonas sp.]